MRHEGPLILEADEEAGMGYYAKEHWVTEHKDVLEYIYQCVVEKGVEAVVVPQAGVELAKAEYNTHKILYAAQLHKHLFDGRYAGLRAVATVSLDAEAGRLVVKPRTDRSRLRAIELPDAEFNNRTVIAFLRSYRGNQIEHEINVPEDFNEDEFVAAAQAAGFDAWVREGSKPSMRKVYFDRIEKVGRVMQERLGIGGPQPGHRPLSVDDDEIDEEGTMEELRRYAEELRRKGASGKAIND
jgi:hypothetical protein